MADLDPFNGFRAEVGGVNLPLEIATAGELNLGIGKPGRGSIATSNQSPALYSLVTGRWRDRAVGRP